MRRARTIKASQRDKEGVCWNDPDARSMLDERFPDCYSIAARGFRFVAVVNAEILQRSLSDRFRMTGVLWCQRVGRVRAISSGSLLPRSRFGGARLAGFPGRGVCWR